MKNVFFLSFWLKTLLKKPSPRVFLDTRSSSFPKPDKLQEGFQYIVESSKDIALSPQFEMRFWAQARRRTVRPALWRAFVRPAVSAVGLAALLIGLYFPGKPWIESFLPKHSEREMVIAALRVGQDDVQRSDTDEVARNILNTVF